MQKVKIIADILILFSIIGFGVIFLPIIKAYIAPEPIPDLSQKSGLFLSIPKISAYAPIIKNIDPWDENEYRRALKFGIAHAKGSSLPGEDGRTFLFAHSSDVPWRMTRTNTPFLRLGELNSGDSVYIYNDGKKNEYRVYDKKEVSPSEVEYLNSPIQGEDLVLQTCTPIGTALRRLLVFAKPV